jgi:hypothetical protein
VSALLFLGAGFIDFVPELNKGDGLRYWKVWHAAVTSGAPVSAIIQGMVVLTVMLAAPCLLLGWVLHCLIMLAWQARHRRPG